MFLTFLLFAFFALHVIYFDGIKLDVDSLK